MPSLSFRRAKSNPEKKSFLFRGFNLIPSLARRLSKQQAVDEQVLSGEERKAHYVPADVDSKHEVGFLPELNIGDLNTCPSEGKTLAPQLQLQSRRPPRCASTIYELIPGKICVSFHPNIQFSQAEIKRRPDVYFFSTDLHERYIPFCKEFGPVSVGTLYQFWRYVRSKEHHNMLRGRPLVYYTSLDPKHQANAAVLLGAYLMLEHKMTANNAAIALERLPQHPFVLFHDISMTTNFTISVRDCLKGLERAMQVGWFDKTSFNLQAFSQLEDPQNGDISVIGKKFVAFRGPNTVGDGEWQMAPDKYILPFRVLGVTCIIRLNEQDCYDKRDFEDGGFHVHDLEFADCSCPSPELVAQFLDICQQTKGRIAVHCKAGLGRTGTMIGLWMMKHMGFTAREAIAWLRLCRPGSVIGPQQTYLESCESVRWDGNFMIPGSQNPLRRQSDGSMRARVQFASRGGMPPGTSEELGKRVEEASRQRSILKRGASTPSGMVS